MKIAPNCDRSKVFNAFVSLAACALAVQTREAEYLEEAKQWTRPDLDSFSAALGALVLEMEDAPYTDLLGAAYMEIAQSNGTRDRGGEFYTPKHVSQLMAQMTVGTHDDSSTDPITVCEPACGAGGMILAVAEALPAAARRRLRVTAIDINRTACNMCFINCSLWGIAARVHHGNALSGEFWASWSNLHYLAPWLRPGQQPTAATVPDLPAQGEPASPAEAQAIAVALGQQAFDFS